jgi:hypothetical protein
MFSRFLGVSGLSLALLALSGTAKAEDTHLLSLPASQDALTLNLKGTDDDLDIETLATGRGGFRGGFRGGVRGGFRGGFYRGGWVGRGGWGRVGWGGRPGYVRGWGWGGRPVYLRTWGGWGWGSPIGVRRWGWSGRPFFVSTFPTRVFLPGTGLWGSPVVVSSWTISPAYVWSVSPTGLGTAIPVMPQATLVDPQQGPTLRTPQDFAQPAPAAPGTYPYNGGPKVPLPLPRAEETMTILPPRKPMLVDDLLVSEQGTGKWTYPAYGEEPTRTGSLTGMAVIATNTR